MTADLSDLLARVEGATGPDRELDAALEGAFRFQRGLDLGLPPKIIAVWRHVGNGDVESQGKTYAAPRYTSSMNEAFAAVSSLRPGLMRFVGDLDPTDMRACATLSERGGVGSQTWRGFGPQGEYALAICASLLRALIAKEPSHD